MGFLETYSYTTASLTASVANQDLMLVYNAVGSNKIVQFTLIESYVRNTSAITGVAIALEGFRITSSGSGGNLLTADKYDTNNANLPSQITCYALPTGVVTASGGRALFAGNIYTEEGANMQAQLAMYDNNGSSIRENLTCREGEGIVIRKGPFSGQGNIGIRLDFIVSSSI